MLNSYDIHKRYQMTPYEISKTLSMASDLYYDARTNNGNNVWHKIHVTTKGNLFEYQMNLLFGLRSLDAEELVNLNYSYDSISRSGVRFEFKTVNSYKASDFITFSKYRIQHAMKSAAKRKFDYLIVGDVIEPDYDDFTCEGVKIYGIFESIVLLNKRFYEISKYNQNKIYFKDINIRAANKGYFGDQINDNLIKDLKTTWATN
jgi:hypothetical protein